MSPQNNKKYSDGYTQVKKLYYQKKAKLKSANIEFNKGSAYAKLVFDDDGKDVTIEGSEPDFFYVSNSI
jgi:hypothetical protein